MLKLASLALSALLITGLTSCAEKPPADEAAEQACACGEPIVDLQKKAQGGEQQDNDQMKATLEEFGTCMQEIEGKFPDMDFEGEFGEKVRAKMEEQCPDVIEAMSM